MLKLFLTIQGCLSSVLPEPCSHPKLSEARGVKKAQKVLELTQGLTASMWTRPDQKSCLPTPDLVLPTLPFCFLTLKRPLRTPVLQNLNGSV